MSSNINTDSETNSEADTKKSRKDNQYALSKEQLSINQRVGAINDDLRKTQSPDLGHWVLSYDVAELQSQNPKKFVELMYAVRDYDNFIADNDPLYERDFGMIKMDSEIFYWKIDYFDPDMVHHCQDKLDTKTCVRVLTIMYSIEY